MNLTELQKVDPELWREIVRGIPLQPRGQYVSFYCGQMTAHQFENCYLPLDQMMPEAAACWLQACLQRAIEVRGLVWDVSLVVDEPSPYMAGIYEIDPGYDGDCWNEQHLSCIAECGGNSPAEALLSAYLEAIHVA